MVDRSNIFIVKLLWWGSLDNLLLPNGNYSYSIIKISLKKEGIMEKLSYKRCVYESVHDESLS